MTSRIRLTLLACSIALATQAQEQRKLDSLYSIFQSNAPDTARYLSLNEIAKQYYRSKPDTAIALAEQVLLWSEEHHYDRGKARSFNIIGLGNWMKSNHSEALTYYQRALPFFEASHDLQGYALCLNNIGLVYFYQGEYSRAIEYYERSLSINEDHHFNEGAALALNNLGLAYEQTGELDKALRHYQSALTIYQSNHEKLGVGQSLTNIGYVYTAMGKNDMALQSLIQAVAIQKEIHDKSTQISSLIAISGIYKSDKRYDDAIANAEEALKIAREIQSTYDERESAITLYHIYKERGDFGRALAYHEQYKNLSDSIFSLENSKAIASLESRVALEKKQKEFETLEKENTLRQRINYITAIALIGMALLSLSIFRNRRKLEAAYHKLEDANSRLTHMKHDVDEKAAMLEESNRAKDKMFSVISHDLRSPLNSVRGMFDLIKSGQISTDELNHFIPEINRKVNNASEILEELLEWSKTQMLSQQTRKRNISVNELLSQTQERFVQPARDKGIDVVAQLGNDKIYVHADADMIRAVLRNLVANAIKFSRTGDRITLKSTATNGNVEMMVCDTGVGIKREDLNKLFHVSGFTTQGTANEKGTGLGLMLCKEFVEKNGGTISVQSEEGAGTTFSVLLPMS